MMAIVHRSGLCNNSPSLLSRLQTLVLQLDRWQHTSAIEIERSPHRDSTSNPAVTEGSFDILTRKIVDSRDTGIRRSMVSPPAWRVLNTLRKEGFETYLVGGCVRDMLLKKTPKDFDVVTTASLKQIKKKFNRCLIVGNLFPICLVRFKDDSVVEVSSFDTTHKNVEDRKTYNSAQMPKTRNKKDFVLWNNCMGRDFTINGLFYDPFAGTIYDYADGIKDLRTSKLRTVIPARLSFKEDCARILRGLRIVARLGLHISKETAAAIRDLSLSIEKLSEQRLMMELNFMLAYGAAEPSIRLLQTFKLLEILLPVQAAYLAHQSKNFCDDSAMMLMNLLSKADKLLAADRPSSCNLWVGLLAFHMALLEHPQDALVVWTFSSFLYHGTWNKAVMSAKENCDINVQFYPEILAPSGSKSDESLLRETSHFASLVKSSLKTFTDRDIREASLARYPGPSPCSSRMIISKRMADIVGKLFNMLEQDDIETNTNERKIDYKLLKKGDPNETRFVLGRIIMDTMSPDNEVIREQHQRVSIEETSFKFRETNHNSKETQFVLGKIIMDTMSPGNNEPIREQHQSVSTKERSFKICEANHNVLVLKDSDDKLDVSGERKKEREAEKDCEYSMKAVAIEKRRPMLSSLFK